MRISEITEENDSWLKLRGIELEIKSDYDEIVDLLDLLIRLESPYRVKSWMPTIDQFEAGLNDRLNEIFPDENDHDIIEFKILVRRMLDDIKRMKSRLPR
jgi:hypothetical protein